jgi:hypothetical protein
MGLRVGKIRQHLFGISPSEATFSRRGFHTGDAGVRRYLEYIGRTFIRGYQAALCHDDDARLASELEGIEKGMRGFAYEGAGMGLALLDQVRPWRARRFREFLEGYGSSHRYMLHVGAGWALARVPWGRRLYLKQLDPLLRWLAMDGYGFHAGYFHRGRYVGERKVHGRFDEHERRAFDCGLGRSLWFVGCADVRWISQAVTTFPPSRRPDLWSGVGLACAYAGGVQRGDAETLFAAAHPYQAAMGQGAAFAAKTRQSAGNPAPHTALACEIFCGLSADAAASLTDVALEQLPCEGPTPAYHVWRERIRSRLSLKVERHETTTR